MKGFHNEGQKLNNQINQYPKKCLIVNLDQDLLSRLECDQGLLPRLGRPRSRYTLIRVSRCVVTNWSQSHTTCQCCLSYLHVSFCPSNPVQKLTLSPSALPIQLVLWVVPFHSSLWPKRVEFLITHQLSEELSCILVSPGDSVGCCYEWQISLHSKDILFSITVE